MNENHDEEEIIEIEEKVEHDKQILENKKKTRRNSYKKKRD